MTCINTKATPTNSTDYSCHIKTIELVYTIIWVHIMSLVINSLGAGIHTHTNFLDKSNYMYKKVKKPGTLGLKSVGINHCSKKQGIKSQSG